MSTAISEGLTQEAVEKPLARRGTSNGNTSGNSTDRRRRREWLVETYRANTDVAFVAWSDGSQTTEVPVCDLDDWVAAVAGSPGVASVTRARACRCYRCGDLLTVETVTVDRIIPGCLGGTYRRNNIRPACAACNSQTGGALAHLPKRPKSVAL